MENHESCGFSSGILHQITGFVWNYAIPFPALSSISQFRLPIYGICDEANPTRIFPASRLWITRGYHFWENDTSQAPCNCASAKHSTDLRNFLSWKKTTYCRLIRIALRLENQTIPTVSIYIYILMPKNKLVQTQGVNNRLFLRPKSAHLPILRPVDWRPGSLNIYCYSYIYTLIYQYTTIYTILIYTISYHEVFFVRTSRLL